MELQVFTNTDYTGLKNWVDHQYCSNYNSLSLLLQLWPIPAALTDGFVL